MNIFVGNLPATYTAEKLRKLFDGFGTVVNAILMRDTVTGLPLGYGHVYLVPEQAAYDAIVSLNSTALKDSPLVARECVFRVHAERRLRRLPWKDTERRVAGSRRHNGYDIPTAESPQQQIG